MLTIYIKIIPNLCTFHLCEKYKVHKEWKDITFNLPIVSFLKTTIIQHTLSKGGERAGEI